MRKLLVLIIALLLLGRLEAADAWTSRHVSYDQLLAKASTVFIGRIIRTEGAGTIQERSDMPPEPVVDYGRSRWGHSWRWCACPFFSRCAGPGIRCFHL
jgi:hypothetical protein